jgi:hypothetical protein
MPGVFQSQEKIEESISILRIGGLSPRRISVGQSTTEFSRVCHILTYQLVGLLTFHEIQNLASCFEPRRAVAIL